MARVLGPLEGRSGCYQFRNMSVNMADTADMLSRPAGHASLNLGSFAQLCTRDGKPSGFEISAKDADVLAQRLAASIEEAKRGPYTDPGGVRTSQALLRLLQLIRRKG